MPVMHRVQPQMADATVALPPLHLSRGPEPCVAENAQHGFYLTLLEFGDGGTDMELMVLELVQMAMLD